MSGDVQVRFRESPRGRFPRATRLICHCRSEAQARSLRDALGARLATCKLALHPQKTKIVYCKDGNRRGSYLVHEFDFLGSTFRPPRSKNRYGRLFTSFAPAVSNKAAKAMRQHMRGWRVQRRTDLDLDELAQWVRPVVRGWVQYYAKFYPSALRCALRTLDHFLVRWAQRKYKRLRGHTKRAWGCLKSIRARQPNLFPHWVPV